MKKSVKYTLIVLAILGTFTLVYAKLKSNQTEVQAKVYKKDVNTSSTVQVVAVNLESFSESISYLGSFSPNREVVIGSVTAGKVVKVGIQEGSYVGTGSLIALLDSDLLQAQLRSAQASYDNAENNLKGSIQANYDNAASTLKRYEQAGSGITQMQLDQARTQLISAKSQIDNAQTQILTIKYQIEQIKKQISQCSIVAPFSGTVTTRNFDLGSVISPGQQMITLTDISALKLEVSVPEKDITQFKKGMATIVKTDIYPEVTFNGRVDLVGIKADASHNYTVKILVTNSTANPLKSGMYGSIILKNKISNSAISIPRAALIGSSIKPQVYVIENGIAKLKNIEIGMGNDKHLQVIKGLNINDLVVTGGLVNLADGVKVTVAK